MCFMFVLQTLLLFFGFIRKHQTNVVTELNGTGTFSFSFFCLPPISFPRLFLIYLIWIRNVVYTDKKLRNGHNETPSRLLSLHIYRHTHEKWKEGQGNRNYYSFMQLGGVGGQQRKEKEEIDALFWIWRRGCNREGGCTFLCKFFYCELNLSPDLRALTFPGPSIGGLFLTPMFYPIHPPRLMWMEKKKQLTWSSSCLPFGFPSFLVWTRRDITTRRRKIIWPSWLTSSSGSPTPQPGSM